MGVAISGFHLKHAITKFQDGNIKGAATEVEHHDGFVIFAFFQAVRQGCRRRLIDDALDFQASDFTSVLGGLALRIVKVGWHGDDCFGDFFAEERLGVGLDFAEDHG